jgi:protease PrsW
MGLLALAIAPGIAICLYILYKDRFNQEPVKNLLISFLLGIFSAVPALIVQLISTKPAEQLFSNNPLAYTAFFAFIVVAFSEEFSKFIMLRLYAFPRKAFDEPLDGIVYSVMVGMGFATIENIGYVMQHGVVTGLVRMVLSVPAHATFAILMGYYAGLAKFDERNRSGRFIQGIFLAVLFHGAFDFFLFLHNSSFIWLGAIASFIIAIVLSRKAINKHQQLSRSNFNSGV